MSDPTSNPALERLLASSENADVLRLLGTGLPGSDTTSLLLAVSALRATTIGPSDVLAQYRRDRFVAPAAVDPVVLARLQLRALEFLSPDFVPIATSPVAPFGTHSVIAGVSQNNVVSTMRMSEIAADTTNQLALEAAVRRSALLKASPRSIETVQLCAVDRVVRAQRFEGARSFAHFTLLGAVIAGRDTGSGRFETASLATVLRAMCGLIHDLTAWPVTVELTDFHGSYSRTLSDVADQVSDDHITCVENPDRATGIDYYPTVCFKISVETQSEIVEIGDGGAVDWTASLLQNRKERLMIVGLSLERLALLQPEPSS